MVYKYATNITSQVNPNAKKREKWKNVAGDNLLNEFYSIPSRWGFTFELYSMFTKIKALREALKSEKDIIIMERSIYSDWVFQDISYALDKT